MSQSDDIKLAARYYSALIAAVDNPDCETAGAAFLDEQSACLQSAADADHAAASIGFFLGGTLLGQARSKDLLAKAYALVDRRILTAGGAFAEAWAGSCARNWQNCENPENILESMLFPPAVALSRPFGLDCAFSLEEPAPCELLAGHPEAFQEADAAASEPRQIRSIDLAAYLASCSRPDIFLRAFWEACDNPESLESVFKQRFPEADSDAFLRSCYLSEGHARAGRFAFLQVLGDPPAEDALAAAAGALAKAFAKLHPALPYAAFRRIAQDHAAECASKISAEAPATEPLPAESGAGKPAKTEPAPEDSPAQKGARRGAPPENGEDAPDLDALIDDDEDEDEEGAPAPPAPQAEETSSDNSGQAPEAPEHPWRVSCRALAKDLENMSLEAFLACSRAFGWHGASCDIGPKPWHEKLETKDLADGTGETLRSIIELAHSQNRSSEPFEGKHILDAMLQAAWNNACAAPHGPRLRGICCSLWNYADPQSPESSAVRSFLDRQGPACAAWLLARTAPDEMAAFVRTHLPELAGEPSESNGLNPSDEEIFRAQACAENIGNPLWDNEAPEAKTAWTALLVRRLLGWLENGGEKLALAGSIRSAFSIMRKRCAAFDALQGAEKCEAIELCGAGNATKFADLRRQCAQASAEYHSAGPEFKFAKAAAVFCWGGASGVKDTLRGIILSRSGISFDHPPEGWAAFCSDEAGKLAPAELSKAKAHLPGILSNSSGCDRDALCAALAASCCAGSDTLAPALEAMGEAAKACDWSKAILLMPRKEAAILMLRSVPAAAGFLASACARPELAAVDAAIPEKWLAHPMSAAAFDAWCAACCSREDGCLDEASALLGFAGETSAGQNPDAQNKNSEQPGAALARPETADIWTPEAWKRFCADIESVDNKDAFASSRSLIKKVRDKKIGPSRKLASGSDLRARVHLLAMRFPHFTPLIGRIAEFCMLSDAGDGSLWFPPMLMIGGAGIGKTYFSSMLAEMAGTELEIADMGGSTAGWVLTGLTDSWHSGKPGRISRTLIHGTYANPVFLLDELDKAEGDPRYSVSPSLLPLLEPHSARHFCDECIPLPIDASRICWLATANDISRMSAPLLSRFDVFELPNPNALERRAMCSGIYEAVTGKYAWGQALAPRLPEDTLDRLACLAAEGAARDLRRSLTSGCAKAVAAGRREVLPEDLPMPEEFSCDPWDRPLAKERA